MIDFLILVLIVVVVFIVLRFAVKKMIADAETQNIIMLVVGLVCVIFLLYNGVGLMRGGGRRFEL